MLCLSFNFKGKFKENEKVKREIEIFPFENQQITHVKKGAAFHLFQVEQKPCTLLGWRIEYCGRTTPYPIQPTQSKPILEIGLTTKIVVYAGLGAQIQCKADFNSTRRNMKVKL